MGTVTFLLKWEVNPLQHLVKQMVGLFVESATPLPYQQLSVIFSFPTSYIDNI
jgi:hypothetical protein